MLEQLKPQVIVIDLRQPLGTGISHFDAARKQTPSIPIIVTSEHSDVKASVRALRNGALTVQASQMPDYQNMRRPFWLQYQSNNQIFWNKTADLRRQ
jgi:DNA-binding NtrC family response regulator